MGSSNPSLTSVFDVDGTLFNSQPFHIEAYHRVGIVMTEEDFGKPWERWLLPKCRGNRDAALRFRKWKAEELDRMLSDLVVPITTAGQAAQQLIQQGRDVYYITSGFGPNAQKMLDAHGLESARLITHSAQPALKNHLLKERFPGGGVYVDDNLVLAHEVISGTNFTAHFYKDQTVEEVLSWMQ